LIANFLPNQETHITLDLRVHSHTSKPFDILSIMRLLFPTAYALALCVSTVLGHSWVEVFQEIDPASGNYTGNTGYIRHVFPRGVGFSDKSMLNQIPPPAAGVGPRVRPTDMICSQSQSTPYQSPGFPQLTVQAGALVASRYLENGHVTLPQNSPNKPVGSGLVYIYATTNSQPLPFLEVAKWTPNNTLAEGRLLAINNFDDGRCYQINGGAISTARQAAFPNPVPNAPTSKDELWCETDFQVPKDAAAGQLSIYWVWQWPTLPSGSNAGKDETYTSCADFNIVTSASTVKAAAAADTNTLADPMKLAVASFKNRAVNTTFPTVKSYYGPSNPNGAAGPAAVGSSPASVPSVPAAAPPAAPPAASSLSAPPYVPSGAPPAYTSAVVPAPATVTQTITEIITVPATQCIGKAPTAWPPWLPSNKKMLTITETQMVTITDDVVATAAPQRARHRHRRHMGERF
jgi:hypothetical protein